MSVSTGDELFSRLRWTNWAGRRPERQRLLKKIKELGLQPAIIEAAFLYLGKSQRQALIKDIADA